MSKIGNILGKIVKGADKLLLDGKVSEVINTIVGSDASPEDKEMALREIDMFLKDRQNARDMNAKVNGSEHASWLSKNIAAILAILVVISSVSTMFIEVEATISNGLIQMSMLVLSFYFGSSLKEKLKV